MNTDRDIRINREKLMFLIDLVKNTPKVAWNGGKVTRTQDGGNVIHLAYPKYPDGLYKSLYEVLGTDPNYSENYAKISKTLDYRYLSLLELRTVITTLVRGERFCDGMIAKAIDSGDLLKILERIKEIDSTMCDAEWKNDHIRVMNIDDYENKQFTLVNSSNPYESVFIDALIKEGCLIINNDYFEHGPDGFQSRHVIRFDKENTRKLFSLLTSQNPDPINALDRMVSAGENVDKLKEACNRANIKYTDSLYL